MSGMPLASHFFFPESNILRIPFKHVPAFVVYTVAAQGFGTFTVTVVTSKVERSPIYGHQRNSLLASCAPWFPRSQIESF
ncbi:hypothetical protein BCR43DRAFT_268012 [Syncephalastrum racemosum]|uniref:Uncharacterized protein n=1 Tax=Syncephalastrum racemosum TaxID=13706 RepID=A0A1X2HBN5_SYNRA|nr:hypothetical protein BCR43DRAFT_268012 [Syncephalastrum racemosum]